MLRGHFCCPEFAVTDPPGSSNLEGIVPREKYARLEELE